MYVAFLDVKKAFDTVWHEGLFVKLHQYRFPLTSGVYYTTGTVALPLQFLEL